MLTEHRIRATPEDTNRMSSRPAAAAAVVMLSIGFPSLARAQTPPDSRWVEISKPYLAKRGGGIVLAHNISSTSSRDRRWAIVDMSGTDDAAPCSWLKIIEPKQSYRFECPLKHPAGQQYSTRVRIFEDAQLNNREIHYVPELAVSEAMVAAAEDAASAPAPVPPATFESIPTTFPATFKSTWYRRVDKGFGMRAYENSGDLTVSADELLFVDGDKTVRIPSAKIHSVRWEPLPNDIANHWIVVRFTNDEGKPDGVAFRDGARLGTRGRSGPIYQAVRNAKK
jgi:hypothetical protein